MTDRVLTIIEAIDMFKIYTKKVSISTPMALKEKFCYELNLDDPIFNTLKSSYDEFNEWWAEK